MGIRKKWSIEILRRMFEEEGYVLTTEVYKNGDSRLDGFCKKGHPYTTTMRDFVYNKKRCRMCYEEIRGKNLRKPFSEFLDALESEGYQYISGEYKDKESKIKVICPNGHETETMWCTFRIGNRCRKCGYISATTLSMFPISEFMYEIESRGYVFVSWDDGKYVGKRTIAQLICPNGHEINMRVLSIMNGHNCSICSQDRASKSRRISFEKAYEIVKHRGDTLLSLTYKNKNAYSTIICGTCNSEFETVFSWYKTSGNKGCSCNRSLGEKRIKEFLEYNQIYFIREKKFDECKSIRKLPFDFYIPSYNLCVEYQGRQHYYSTPEFGGDEALESLKVRDAIKKNFCIDNGINFLEIPYWQHSSIEKILSDYLFS